jgi:hypothetical protein
MRAKICRTLALTGLLVAFTVHGARSNEAAATAAVAELKQLYAEFLTFKNDSEFRTVGYGRCCKYFQWMQKVEALRGANVSDFINQFGILPGELIALGTEYYRGRGKSETARLFEAKIASVEQPIQSEAAINATTSATDKTIGTWTYTLYGTMKETIIIKLEKGKFIYFGQFSDGSNRLHGLVEIAPQDGQMRRFRAEQGTAPAEYGTSYAILTDGRLALYDREGLIRTATRQ